MRYVIIGNSAAAIGAVEGIRQVDLNGEITLISKEPYHTYSRPLISYLLCGKTDGQKMKYRDDGFYDRMNCGVLLNKTVTGIDAAARRVTLDDNSALTYDKLLVATGSEPFIPPVAGLDSVKNKFTFLSLDDAKKLDGALSSDARVLIIGAGLIGLKCAEGISKKVRGITVVELADRILSSILDGEGAKAVQSHIEKHNIEFMLNCCVKSFSQNTAFLSSGAQIDFDILVLAVGVRPNTGLIKEAGGEVRRGIAVDEFSRTSLPDIYAAGDCCESFDITSGESRVLALLPNAYMQGECAGLNMEGGSKAYDKAVPMNAIGFFGLHLITAGSYIGEAYTQDDTVYKKLFVKDGVLKGYILIGNVEKAGIYTSLLREKTPLEDIDFELIRERPGLMAFSRAERSKRMGGAENEN